MSRRVQLLGAVMAIAVIGAGCSRSVDVDSVESSTAKNPSWVSKAYADARKKLNADAPLEAPATDESTTTTTAAPVDGLPPKDQFVAALSATGLDPTAAGCIYDSIEGTPLAATTGKLLASASDPLQAAVANNNGIDEATQKQLLVALAPCLDTKTLLSVLGSVSGASGTATGGTGATPSTTLPNINAMQTLLASVIKQAGTLSSSVNASSLAKAAGANLTPAQIQALQNAIAAAQNLQTTDTSQIDLSKLDVSKLNQEQLVDLISVLIKGLTPAQLAQLNQVAAVDLQDLNLNIDVSKLSHDELGSLFVVLLPFIAAGISAPGGQAPSGVQPGQIYIPPGTDLSDINPLNFVPQETVVAGLEKQYGLSAGVSTCLYQKVKQIDPRLLGAAYQGTNLTGAAQLLLSVLSCVGA